MSELDQEVYKIGNRLDPYRKGLTPHIHRGLKDLIKENDSLQAKFLRIKKEAKAHIDKARETFEEIEPKQIRY